jgi:hypothetical protein
MTEIAALSNGARLFLMAALLQIICAVASALAGLLGVGGGIVLVPAFFLYILNVGLRRSGSDANVPCDNAGNGCRHFNAVGLVTP